MMMELTSVQGMLEGWNSDIGVEATRVDVERIMMMMVDNGEVEKCILSVRVL